VGAAIGREEEAQETVRRLQARIDAVLRFVAGQPQLKLPKVGWMEWTEPIFVSHQWVDITTCGDTLLKCMPCISTTTVSSA